MSTSEAECSDPPIGPIVYTTFKPFEHKFPSCSRDALGPLEYDHKTGKTWETQILHHCPQTKGKAWRWNKRTWALTFGDDDDYTQTFANNEAEMLRKLTGAEQALPDIFQDPEPKPPPRFSRWTLLRKPLA